MIAVDTDILIRLLTEDEPVQCAQARKLVGHHSIFIPETVLLECEWVLRCAYGFSSKQVHGGLTRILGRKNVPLARPLVIYDALNWFENGMDFAAALHLAGCSHCDKLATFDRAFIKSAKGVSPCIAVHP
jgi:predicted nucleic-acid-binding protein